MGAEFSRYVRVTKSTENLPNGDCRGLLVGVAGTANLLEPDGWVRDGVPLQAGFNPLRARQVRPGGSAQNIWALY